MKDITVEQKRCLELARIIREGLPGVIFSMNAFREDTSCGTTACIAGHAVAVYAPNVWRLKKTEKIDETAQRLLGLDDVDKLNLFYGHYGPAYGPKAAAAVLENFALTGKVVWK